MVAAHHRNSQHLPTSSNCLLSTGQSSSVHCEPEGGTIQPECVQFDSNFHPTFEVFLTRNPESATLIIQDQERTEVWKRVVPLTGRFRENLERNVPAEDNVPAKQRLFAVGTQFIESVSDPVLKRLLDELLECGVISDGEMQSARGNSRADKTREGIDMVRGKGREPGQVLIAAVCKQQPSFRTPLLRSSNKNQRTEHITPFFTV
ncbi:hypothetical protein Q8A73_010761 [Channa argus]|nr:hypothetical protein Q8A73_010761 [Channa argus]